MDDGVPEGRGDSNDLIWTDAQRRHDDQRVADGPREETVVSRVETDFCPEVKTFGEGHPGVRILKVERGDETFDTDVGDGWDWNEVSLDGVS